jgi:hypothetical protein
MLLDPQDRLPDAFVDFDRFAFRATMNARDGFDPPTVLTIVPLANDFLE